MFSQCEGPVGRVDYFDASAVVLLQPLKEPLAEQVSAVEFSPGYVTYVRPETYALPRLLGHANENILHVVRTVAAWFLESFLESVWDSRQSNTTRSHQKKIG